MDAQTFVTHIRKAKQPADLFHILEVAARKAGFAWLAYMALNQHEQYGPSAYPAPAILLRCPADWSARYFAQGYQAIDPILTHSAEIGAPYLWRWLPHIKQLSRIERRLLAEAQEAGLKQGMTVPLPGPHGPAAILSFATDSDGISLDHHLGRFGFYAAVFHAAYVTMIGVGHQARPGLLLTRRERECLHWIAAGKSSFEIGIILGISQHTVRSYSKTIFHKLNVSNRSMAVARAVALGLLKI
ncbi:LuxR family transcriptional regulator [Govanella unica]|uniref:LuxR family transcriptional regulator n=1 Tax=Govanella unica TaxID=2975056 RepID=A0A9X3Z773_9PROT|nr:LuxR family transcriptional regulator [Govania unica]MDA5193684.1 LuxR family transcriptional regulator [Govania unica]